MSSRHDAPGAASGSATSSGLAESIRNLPPGDLVLEAMRRINELSGRGLKPEFRRHAAGAPPDDPPIVYDEESKLMWERLPPPRKESLLKILRADPGCNFLIDLLEPHQINGRRVMSLLMGVPIRTATVALLDIAYGYLDLLDTCWSFRDVVKEAFTAPTRIHPLPSHRVFGNPSAFPVLLTRTYDEWLEEATRDMSDWKEIIQMCELAMAKARSRPDP